MTDQIDIADMRAKLAAATEAKGADDVIRTYLSLAETVLGALPALLDEIERLRDLVSDFAKHGLRFDLNPTLMLGPGESAWAQLTTYMRRMDQSVRDRARAALEAARQAGGAAA